MLCGVFMLNRLDKMKRCDWIGFAAASSFSYASPAYFRPPLVLVGPTTSTFVTPKINPKVSVMGILSRYFYGYWYVFAHRRHYQLWYRFQYILDLDTLYIWQLHPVLLCFFTEGKDISYIKRFDAGLLSDYRWCLL